MWVFIWFAVSSLVLSNTAAQECMGCTYDGKNARCAYLDLTFIPVCLPPSTTDLFYVFNDLSTFPADSFSGLTNMQFLDLGTNKISTLPEDVFSYMPNLLSLNLEHNHITYLPDNIFANNDKIVVLVLSYNNLTVINPVALNPLRSLDYLNIQSNSIEILNDNRTFFYNAAMTNLDLSYNDLKTMDKSIFASNSRMELWIPGNLWHCDCVITDLLEYLRSVYISFPPYYYPKCHSPPELDGLYWTEIDPQPCNGTRIFS